MRGTLLVVLVLLALTGCNQLHVAAKSSVHCDLAPNAKPPDALLNCSVDGVADVVRITGPPMKLTGCAKPPEE